MNVFRQIPLLVCLLFISALTGCNRGPQMCEVTGKVSFQGKAVEEGDIVFADVDKRAPTAAGRIEFGKYRVKVLPGKKSVRITGNKKTGKTIREGMAPEVADRVDLIPAKYNLSTTLVRSVKPQDTMQLDFPLD